MPVHKKILEFAANGEYLAYSSPDGCLKIWETSTNILKQEYTPSSHLSATCTALSWCPEAQKNHASPKKSKKARKANNFSAASDLQLIAMGTMTGEILLYSFANADLHSQLTNGHTDVINDLCWCSSTSSLYSCSNDKNIVLWDIFSGKVKTKWKADNSAVHSICVLDSNNILSASHSITWWNVEEKTAVKTFTGHATEVCRLLSLRTEEALENSYFLSAAVGDRIINVWQLNDEKSKRAVASFVVSDDPENISFIAEKEQTLSLSVVCKDGSLHMFEHILNGRKKKPLQAKFSLQIASKACESHTKPKQIPVLCASLSQGLSSCLLAYGNLLRPLCEKIDLSDVSKDLFLIRDISGSSTSQEMDVYRIKQAVKSEPVKLLAPGHMMPVKDIQSVPRKRKKKEAAEEKELPMEERLRALDLSKLPPNLDEPVIKTDSMVHMLLQGLQSKDHNLLSMVLQNGDEQIIRNTLKRLPLPSIVVLLKELQQRLTKQEQRNHPCLKWMENLLAIHLPYLMSCKDIDTHLGPISQLIEARVENFSKMCQLQGCLRILLSQTSTSTHTQVESNQPLAVYQSDSSEESESDEHNGDVSDEEHEDAVLDSSSSDSESEKMDS